MTDGYDVIGDVHGCHDALVALLGQLGYVERAGAWRHASRVAVFVGDLIDRGPQQVEVVQTVRSMIDAGSAVMCLGNHEWNAMGWVRTGEDGQRLRPDTEKNRDQHSAFLAQVGEESALHHEIVDWFTGLPLWLEVSVGSDQLRVVHACWDDVHINAIDADPYAARDDTFIVRAHTKESVEHTAIEVLLKGPEATLPDGKVFYDKGKHARSGARLAWWQDADRNWRRATLIDAEIRATLPDEEIRTDFPEFGLNDPPVIFGHYWNTGPFVPVRPRFACVDFSAVLGGNLVAYRWSGEQELSAENFVGVNGLQVLMEER